MSSNLSTQQINSQSNSIESLSKVQKQSSNESFSNTKIDPDINLENMECSECAKNTESNTIEGYGRSRYCRAAAKAKRSAYRYLRLYRRTKRRAYLNYYRRYMRYYHRYRRYCRRRSVRRRRVYRRTTRRTTRRTSSRNRYCRAALNYKRSALRYLKIYRRTKRRAYLNYYRRYMRYYNRYRRYCSRRTRRVIRRRTYVRRARRSYRRRTRRTRRKIRRTRRKIRRARRIVSRVRGTVRTVRRIRKSVKDFRKNSGNLLLAILFATIPGFFIGWFLPKKFTGLQGRFVVPFMQFLFLILAFMIKDGNKCRKLRLGNSVSNAGYTWLLTFVLHLITKYGAQKAQMLSISDNYMNPMGVNLMTMLNTLLSMGLVSLTTSRKNLCKKKFNTKIAMFLAIISIMGQGILLNEPLQVVANVVEDIVEEVIEIDEIIE